MQTKFDIGQIVGILGFTGRYVITEITISIGKEISYRVEESYSPFYKVGTFEEHELWCLED